MIRFVPPPLGAGCMCGLNNPLPAPDVDDVKFKLFSLETPSLLLRGEAPWKKAVVPYKTSLFWLYLPDVGKYTGFFKLKLITSF